MSDMNKKIEKLEDVVYPKGTGISNLKAKKVKRDGDLCMYERSDNVFEVFFVQVNEAGEIYGRNYPKREIYPSNESFGKTAWCFNDRKLADRCYDKKLEAQSW